MLRWVTATHTQRYHAHYRTSGEGHLYQSRFKSFPIQDDQHFLVVCRYVERNALRAGLVSNALRAGLVSNALRAGLVKRAEQWRFGSLWRWLQTPEPEPSLLSAWPIRRSPIWVKKGQRAAE